MDKIGLRKLGKKYFDIYGHTLKEGQETQIFDIAFNLGWELNKKHSD